MPRPAVIQIELAGADDLVVAEAVAVQDFAFDEPAEGLQRSVRMGADVHAVAGLERHWTGVVEKTPGADHAPLPGGQGAADDHAVTQIGCPRFNFFDDAHTFPLVHLNRAERCPACRCDWIIGAGKGAS